MASKKSISSLRALYKKYNIKPTKIKFPKANYKVPRVGIKIGKLKGVK